MNDEMERLRLLDLEIKNYLDSTEVLDVDKVCGFLSRAYNDEVTWRGFQFWETGDLFKFRLGKVYNMKPISPYTSLLAIKFLIQWLNSEEAWV